MYLIFMNKEGLLFRLIALLTSICTVDSIFEKAFTPLFTSLDISFNTEDTEQ
jgi:hypothetical protein